MLYLAVLTDVIHALLMVCFVGGLPFLFWHRFPKGTTAYCIYCLAFIIVNQVSQYTLGCCIFTTIAGWFYHQANHAVSNEWFAVRAANFIFGLTPSHKTLNHITEFLVAIAAIGWLYLYIKRKKNVTGEKA